VNDDDAGKALVRERGGSAPGAILDCPDVSFDITAVIIRPRRVQCWEVGTEWFELLVGVNRRNNQPAVSIQVGDFLETFFDGVYPSIWEWFDGAKLEFARNGNKKSNFVDKHYVNGEGNVVAET
jgi:hypothetical protein